jgi:hypothetical protein
VRERAGQAEIALILPRLVFVLAFVVSLSFGLCNKSSGDTHAGDQLKALKAAMVVIGDDPNNVPPIGQNYNCTISIGHQPAQPASPFKPVLGSCLWTVVNQGNLWLATFRESWLCKDWSANATGYPACQDPTGFHEWQYQVDLKGPVQEISSTGAFAPDM